MSVFQECDVVLKSTQNADSSEFLSEFCKVQASPREHIHPWGHSAHRHTGVSSTIRPSFHIAVSSGRFMGGGQLPPLRCSVTGLAPLFAKFRAPIL